jgi:hypothetical protein
MPGGFNGRSKRAEDPSLCPAVPSAVSASPSHPARDGWAPEPPTQPPGHARSDDGARLTPLHLGNEVFDRQPVLATQSVDAGPVLDELVGPADPDDGRLDLAFGEQLHHGAAVAARQRVILERDHHIGGAAEELVRTASSGLAKRGLIRATLQASLCKCSAASGPGPACCPREKGDLNPTARQSSAGPRPCRSRSAAAFP